MTLVILYYFLIAIMIVGIIGELLPAVPGMSLILIAMLVWGFVTKFAGMGVALAVAFVILLLSLGVEFLASYLGAQKVGASNWSQIGLVVGLLAGIFGLLPALPIGGPIIGLFVGPVVGAFVGEYAYRRDLELTPRLQQSLKVCVGIVVGTVIGHVAKAMLATAAVIVFIVTTWPNLSSVISFQFSVISFQFSVFSYQVSVFSFQFSDLSSLFFN